MNGKFLLLFFLMIFSSRVFSQGPFAPAAGQPGSTAIYKDSSIIVSWATGIEIYRGYVRIDDPSFTNGGSNLSSYGYPSIALGAAQESSYDVVSLGDGGYAILSFDRPIINGLGPDFAVFENSFSDTFLELAFVEVSSDGERFVRFPAISLTQTQTQVGGFGTIDPTNIHNFAGKYRQGYGTPFDLEDIADSTGIDINNIRFVKIIDVVGNINDQFCTYDSQGNKVNDPWPTPFNSSGFDLDAVAVINAGEPYTISNFDDLNLAVNSFWNGSDQSGGFSSNGVYFANNYNSDWNSWSGWSYSNMRDVTTPGFENQFSAITGGGIYATDIESDIYAIAYVPIDWMSGTYEPVPVPVEFAEEVIVNGFYVTNSTYAYLSMLNGDGFAKKFGGADGNDPDYFKLIIWGEDNDENLTDQIEFYLSDYRFADNSKDYIVNNWRWVDLQSLGAVKKLWFSLESSDVGDFGMNTPAYYCIDNMSFYTNSNNTTSLSVNSSEINITAYPNPFASVITISSDNSCKIQISDITGKLVYSAKFEANSICEINLENFSSGIYILNAIASGNISSLKIIKL